MAYTDDRMSPQPPPQPFAERRAAPRQPQLVSWCSPQQGDARTEIVAGLQAPEPSIAPKYFYDALGSHLFTAITALDSYYPTRTEAAILAARGSEIADALGGPGRPLVDLGAGDGAKAARLFPLLRPSRYVAIDISADYLGDSLRRLQREHPALEMLGLAMDFSRQLVLPAEAGAGPRTLFYPGSSIGNFTPAEALRFLTEARAAAQGGQLLIGVDLVKDRHVLEAAYDDPQGVTAAFNLNALVHVNRLLGSDFDPRDWRHVAHFNEALSRIEMHLEARHALDVRWPGGQRRFAAGERIHTENSYKFSVEGFDGLLRTAGWSRTRAWTDPRGWFAVFVAG
jgi:L-histidine N-alpha-methyltransferase